MVAGLLVCLRGRRRGRTVRLDRSSPSPPAPWSFATKGRALAVLVAAAASTGPGATRKYQVLTLSPSGIIRAARRGGWARVAVRVFGQLSPVVVPTAQIVADSIAKKGSGICQSRNATFTATARRRASDTFPLGIAGARPATLDAVAKAAKRDAAWRYGAHVHAVVAAAQHARHPDRGAPPSICPSLIAGWIEARCDQTDASSPPSTGTIAPTTYFALLETRYATASATSFGSPT